ncbi:hypothetical protein ACFWPH_29885 [Nocardia sp. NPDC058499]|uniref:hypothetical protein n=1 Tax=Nocardia sp. NPDC058499 TaxID=3346530 RepID=UPI003647C87B
MQWRQASASWRTNWVQGKTFEKGLDVVFGLTASGWEREVDRETDSATGKGVRTDFQYRDHTEAVAPQNIEAKSGALDKEREVKQLEGYQQLLQQGETVQLFTRAERDKEMSKEARTLIAVMKAEFPNRFRHRPMNERVYQRIMEAGARALERERRQEITAQLSRIPERDARALSIAEIAREYAKEAPTAGIEQLRFMARELREMAQTQAVAERDLAAEDRKKLGLRFQAAQELEKEHNTQLVQKETERHNAIDPITFALVERERELIDRGTQQAAQELQQQLHSHSIDLEQARHHFLGLAYALGKNQELERRTERDAAARAPHAVEKITEQLHRKEQVRLEKDQQVSRQIGAMGAVVEYETGRRNQAELSRLAIEVNRERLIARGVDPEKARLQAPTLPAPVLRDSDRGQDPQQLARELGQRDRERASAREKAIEGRVAEFVAKGVPDDVARATVLARLSMPVRDHRSARERHIKEVEKDLLTQGIPPGIARAAAEGRVVEEPPQVKRATAAREARERELERQRGHSRGQ